jgi:hypothetical protein
VGFDSQIQPPLFDLAHSNRRSGPLPVEHQRITQEPITGHD